MSVQPTWAPTAGETFGEWRANRITSSLLIWDRVEDSIDEHVARVSSASAVSNPIDPDLDFVSIRSDADTNVALLPKISEFGIGRTLRIFFPENGVRLRTQGDGTQFINGTVGSSTNEQAILGKMLVYAVATDARTWFLTAWNDIGANIPLKPIVRALASNLEDENGSQAVTAVATTGVLLNDTAKHADVTSATSTDVVKLAQPIVGKVTTGYVGANGCSLQASKTYGTSDDVKINNVICTSGTTKAAIPATSKFTCTCVSKTEWILEATTELGAVITAIVPA